MNTLRTTVLLAALTGLLVAVGAFIGGIAPQSMELTARGVPEGQGNVRFGGNVGGGVEFRFIGRTSVGFEYRYHKIDDTNGDFSTVVGKLGFHF